MKISVVIVTFNGIQWIEKVIKTVFSSTIDVEIIVVDNNSSDGTLSVIRKYKEIDLVESKINLGFGKANNIGIKKAYESGSDYVFLLNQDAWIESATIEKLVYAHQKERQYGVLSPMHLNGKGDALDYKFSLYINPSRCRNIYSDIYLKKTKSIIYEAEFVNAAAWLISKECIEKVGGFNPSFFHYGEDDNYIQRIKFHSFKLGVVPTCVIFHDREKQQNNIYFKDEMIMYKRSLISKFSNPFNKYSFKSEYKKNYYLLIKAIAFLQIKNVKKCLLKIKILNQLDKGSILKNKNESKILKSSFLN